MKIAAAYIRVSTEEQTELSPDSQIKLIREYAKKNDFIVPDEFIFHDDGISGRTTSKRPAFNTMIGTAKLKPKPFDAILVWKFSRFARNREDSIVYKSMLRKLGIDVISISENVGDDKMSVLIEAMIEAMDEYYSINLAEEVKRGMLEKLSRGKIVNAPPIGYKIKDGEYIPDENAKLIKYIYNEFISGNGYLSIAKKINDMGYLTAKGNKFENRTIEYIIRNPVYAGKLRWTPGGGGSRKHYHNTDNVMIVDGSHEPIIDYETWQKAQDIALKYKKQYSRKSKEIVENDFMLRGLLRCSVCGAVLVNSGDGYQCHKYAHGLCNESHYISKTKADQYVINGFESALENIDNINVIIKKSEHIKLNQHTTELISREYDKLQRVKEAYASGIDSLEEYKENKMKINLEINRLKTIAEKEKSADIPKDVIKKTITNHIKEFLTLFYSPDVTQSTLNKSLRNFVDRIVFEKKNHEITIFYYM